MEGYGIVYLTNGSIYHGEFKNNTSNGFGIYYEKNKYYYIGQHKDGNSDGYGIMNDLKLEEIIKEEFKNGFLQGYGIKYLPNGDIIEGYCEYNYPNGIVFLYRPNGERYIKYYETGEEIFCEKIE